MSVFAIADLHLSLAPDVDKPMDVFGPRWYDYVARLEKNWRETVGDDDTVIIAGDISWALKLENARYDLDFVASLPGHKLIFKGNHDLWWSSITKLNNMYDSITFVQNDFYRAEDFVVCGTRGWLTPENEEYCEADEKVYKRELLRMESSLALGKKHMLSEDASAEMIAIMHFPPVSKVASFSGFQQLFEDYGIKQVFYGHVHGEDGFKTTIRGNYHGVEYNLISLDFLNCKPIRISRSNLND